MQPSVHAPVFVAVQVMCSWMGIAVTHSSEAKQLSANWRGHESTLSARARAKPFWSILHQSPSSSQLLSGVLGSNDGLLRISQRGWNGLYRPRLIPWHRAFIPLTKDHLAGSGLQDRCDRDVNGLADHLAGIVDYNHGPIIEVGDALVVLLAFLQDENPHDLARQHDGLERVC